MNRRDLQQALDLVGKHLSKYVVFVVGRAGQIRRICSTDGGTTVSLHISDGDMHQWMPVNRSAVSGFLKKQPAKAAISAQITPGTSGQKSLVLFCGEASQRFTWSSSLKDGVLTDACFPPSIPYEDVAMVSPVVLSSNLERVLPAACSDPSEPRLNGIHVWVGSEQMSVVASDGHGLLCRTFGLDVPARCETSMLVPAKAMKKLLSMLPIQGQVGMFLSRPDRPSSVAWSRVSFRWDQVEVEAKLVSQPVLSYEQLIPRNPTVCIVVDRLGLEEATKQMIALGKEAGFREVGGLVAYVSAQDGCVKLWLGTEKDPVKETVQTMAATLTGPPVLTNFRLAHLINIARAFQAGCLQLTANQPRLGAWLIEGTGDPQGLGLITPVV